MVWFDQSLRFRLCETGNDGYLETPPIKECFSGAAGSVSNIGVCFTGIDGWSQR